VYCGKMAADRIGSDPKAVWCGRSDRPRYAAVTGFGDRGRGTFWGEFGVRYCKQWGLYDVAVRQCLKCRTCGLGWCMGSAEALLY